METTKLSAALIHWLSIGLMIIQDPVIKIKISGGPGDGPVTGVSKLKTLLALPSSSDVLPKPFVQFVKEDDQERFFF